MTNKYDISFEQSNLCPLQTIDLYSKENSLVNALCIVTELKWQEIVKKMVTHAHEECTLPTEKSTIEKMLQANGFTKIKKNGSLVDIINWCKETEQCFNYIVKSRVQLYYSLIYNKETNQYTVKGYSKDNYISPYTCITEIWQFVPGCNSYEKSIKKTKPNGVLKSRIDFTPININPENNYTGDCAIRALATAYNCSWHDAIDHIAESTKFLYPILNLPSNINITLVKLGFERHEPYRRYKKLLNGKQFCELLNHMHLDNERIFAYVGSNHCAAIIPSKTPEGKVIYKVNDTWDSTNKYIKEYWTIKLVKKKNVNSDLVLSEIKIGAQIHHPKYGNGEIINIIEAKSERMIEVTFPIGNKILSESWLKKTQNSFI